MKTSFIFLLWLCCISAFAADTITGHVRNGTLNKPSPGDQVILLQLGDGMQEESHAVTGSDGAFSIAVTRPAASHLLRVVHQGVIYDQKVSGSSSLQLQVFDAVPVVPGLSGKVGMAQFESAGALLKVTEMYDIANLSQPPVTQAGAHNFEFSIPPAATLDSFQAKRAGGVWVNLKPAIISADTNRFAVDFPLRPGETLLRFVYRLPADSAATFKLHPAYPVANFAVAHPPPIRFKAARAGDFTSPGVARGLRLEQVVTSHPIREIPAFEISGIGTAPNAPASGILAPAPAAATTHNPVSVAGSAAASGPGEGMWPLVVALACLLTTIVFGALRRRRQTRSGVPNLRSEKQLSRSEGIYEHL